MTIEEAKVCLKGIKIISKDIFTEQTDLQDCLDIAIKSLDMWDKVIEHIKQTYDIMCNCDCVGKNCNKECFEGDNVQAVECIQIIEECKKEIEECKKEIEECL